MLSPTRKILANEFFNKDIHLYLENYLRNASAAEVRSLRGKMIEKMTPAAYGGHFFKRDDASGRGDELVAYELEYLMNTQSIGMAVDIIPSFYPYFDKVARTEKAVSLLDVGTRTGAGSDLIGRLFATYFSNLVVSVDTLDIDPSFAEYQGKRWQHTGSSLVGDIFEIAEKSHDYVLCSHTIEHVDNPVEFCKRLTKLARRQVFIYCPFNELDPIPGHKTITSDHISSLCPVQTRYIKSWWFRKNEEMTECVFFVLEAS